MNLRVIQQFSNYTVSYYAQELIQELLLDCISNSLYNDTFQQDTLPYIMFIIVCLEHVTSIGKQTPGTSNFNIYW